MNTKQQTKKSTPKNGGENKVKRKRNRKRNENNAGGNGGLSMVSKNVPFSTTTVVRNDRKNSKVYCSGCDFVTDITGTTSFSVQKSIPVNPGLVAAFPITHQMAKLYQFYRFTKFAVKFIAACASSHAGSILMVPEFNINDPAPESWAAGANDGLSIQSQSYASWYRAIPIPRMFNTGTHKMIRCGNVPDSKNLYDALTVYICTQNQSNTSTIGSIYFDYEIEFVTRQTSLSYDPAPTRANYYTYSGSQIAMVDGTAQAYPYNTLESDWNPLSIPSPVSGKFILPCGAYIITASVGYNDSTSEFFFTNTYIIKNGSIVGAESRVSSGRNGVTPASYVTSIVCALVISNGTDEFQIMAESNESSAGTVYLSQGTSFLLIQTV